MIRTGRAAGDVATTIRAAVQGLDANVALVRIEGMREIIDQALTNRRFHLTLLGVFAVTALMLACVGIYGVLSYSVARQTREIGVRMALGARAAAVAGHVVWRGGQLAIGGVVIGVAGALLSREVIASQLFDVEPFDPLVYASVSAILLLVAVLACWLPARRAASIPPTQALRAE
jgi:putative ABC transport system permease protein